MSDIDEVIWGMGFVLKRATEKYPDFDFWDLQAIVFKTFIATKEFKLMYDRYMGEHGLAEVEEVDYNH